MTAWIALLTPIAAGVVLILRWWLSESNRKKRRLKRERKKLAEMADNIRSGDSGAIRDDLDDLGV